jgi:hypothetical protein
LPGASTSTVFTLTVAGFADALAIDGAASANSAADSARRVFEIRIHPINE